MPAIKLCIIGGGSAYMTSMFGTIARDVREKPNYAIHHILRDVRIQGGSDLDAAGEVLSCR